MKAISLVSFLFLRPSSAFTTSNYARTRLNHGSGMSDRSRRKHMFFPSLPIETDERFLTMNQQVVGAVLKEPLIEVLGCFLVLLSSFLVAVSTVNAVDLKMLASIIRVENLIAYIFAIEFFVRWYAQFSWKGIVQYLTRPLVVIDLFVVILPLIPLIIPNAVATYDIFPDWLFSSSGLVNLRLLRVLRFQRVLADMDTFADFQMALGIPRTEFKPYKLRLARVILSLFTLLSISAGLIYSTEHTVNPGIPDYFTALYFGLTTLTTVGFGDVTPITPEGKFVVCASILAGVAVVPAQAASLVEALLAREEYKGKGTQPTKPMAQLSTKEVDEDSMAMVKAVCLNCDAGHHWASAQFCWSCGTKLQ